MLLATTAIEDTWGADEEVLFLGEWCKLYGRKAAWAQRNSKVLKYHWDDRSKLKRDHEYLEIIHRKLLDELARILNQYHHTDCSVRYWQLIIDPWLLTYVAVIWDRWESLRCAFDENQRLKTIELVAEGYVFDDYNDFMSKIQSDEWNYIVCLDIIKSNYNNKCEQIREDKGIVFSETAKDVSRIGLRSIKHSFVKYLDVVFSKLSSRRRVVLYHTYFTLGRLVRLHLGISHVPRLYVSEFEFSGPYPAIKINRDDIRVQLRAKNKFEEYLYKRVVKDIPSSFIEGFSFIKKRVEGIDLSPRLIVTAGGHWSNDLFKVWCAEQTLKGVKLITMAHGGALPPEFSCMSFEESISDTKTVWSIPFHSKHKRMPPSKLVNNAAPTEGKYLSIIGNEMPRYSYRIQSSPCSGQSLESLYMVTQLYKLLSEDIKKFFQIKPYPNRGWDTRQRFVDILGARRVTNEKKLSRFISSSRVVICTYPQTTFAESIVSGKPTVLFYPEQYWETIPEMEGLINLLKKVGIIFVDYRLLANHLNEVWKNPIKWWGSEEVLEARNEMNLKLFDHNTDSIKEWARFINQNDSNI